MGYEATTGVIIYRNPDQPFVIHITHHIFFYEYNSRLTIEDKHTPGYLILQQYPASLIHNSDLLNLIQCEIDLPSTPFINKKILTSEIE